MKKLLILLLALSMLACFAACNDNDEPLETTPVDTTAKAEVSEETSTEDESEAKTEKPEKEQVSTGDGWTANY